MGTAMLGPWRFRLDPSSVSWDFTIKAVDLRTVGGKVIQVFGTQYGDMTVTGNFGQGGATEQRKMLESMSAVGDKMMAGARTKASHRPIRFLYPARKWDFQVYLKGFSTSGSDMAVREAPEVVNRTWTLTLMIVEDLGNVKKVAQDAYIARLAAGLGWRLSTFNAPTPQSAGEAVAAAGGIQQYLANNFITGTPPGAASATPPPATPPAQQPAGQQ